MNFVATTKENNMGRTDITYRFTIIDRLNRRAEALQSAGRWEEADSLLIIAGRYEALWVRLGA